MFDSAILTTISQTGQYVATDIAPRMSMVQLRQDPGSLFSLWRIRYKRLRWKTWMERKRGHCRRWRLGSLGLAQPWHLPSQSRAVQHGAEIATRILFHRRDVRPVWHDSCTSWRLSETAMITTTNTLWRAQRISLKPTYGARHSAQSSVFYYHCSEVEVNMVVTPRSVNID